MYTLFSDLISATFRAKLGMADEGLTDYLARMLSEFAHFDKVYQISDLAGKPMSEVAHMMNESSTLLNATSCVREREVHKHIGDYTLFWTGVYPESLHLLQNTLHKDHLLDYVQQVRGAWEAETSGQWQFGA